jgi:hypothetical protein
MPNTRMNLHFATRRQSRQLAEQLPLALHDRAVGPLTPSNSNAVTEITMRSELTPTSDGITFKFPTAHQFCEYGPRERRSTGFDSLIRTASRVTVRLFTVVVKTLSLTVTVADNAYDQPNYPMRVPLYRRAFTFVPCVYLCTMRLPLYHVERLPSYCRAICSSTR